ncbi:hypothetical protein Agub_g419 [Astrephomene gubernaculifera]|uniref:Pentatricopeptide repeat-containing protein n=1 Tax=Astrephomene gubernaculifera TaxID=47775 RepID=A0AAD3DE04_9CHLO|nr:hypothetical protein Agub_g419 [Astrephomene gubernaculifera]
MHALYSRYAHQACHLSRRRASPAVPQCPGRRFLSAVRRSAIPAHRTAEEYSQLLRSCDDDWTRTLELVTEVNILRINVEPQALECAVVSFARGGQWQRAENLYLQLKAQGHVPGSDTLTALVAGLAGSQQGDRAAAILDEVSELQGDTRSLAPAYNLVTRALARQGQLDASYQLLTRMMRSEVPVEGSTFTCLASCCMGAERTQLAEEVLEMRDYL